MSVYVSLLNEPFKTGSSIQIRNYFVSDVKKLLNREYSTFFNLNKFTFFPLMTL